LIERFIALVRRELQADDVRVLDAGEQAPDAVNVLSARLHDGRLLIATFASAPDAKEALSRRLEILAGTFSQSADEGAGEGRGSRPPTRSLHHELKALVTRSNAVDAVVIDANSPMIWGSATERGPRSSLEDSIRRIEASELGSGPEVLSTRRSSRPPPADDADDPGDLPEASRRAIDAVRALPQLAIISKGKHLRQIEREGPHYLASSFGIYILVVVFDAPFDELRAERAAQEALPQIERLVLALPPHNPEPPVAGAGVVRLRRPRR
jgi:hypothetical protein